MSLLRYDGRMIIWAGKSPDQVFGRTLMNLLTDCSESDSMISLSDKAPWNEMV